MSDDPQASEDLDPKPERASEGSHNGALQGEAEEVPVASVGVSEETEPADPLTAQSEGVSKSSDAEGWGQASRAFVLTFLIGMALVTFFRIGFTGDWVHEFFSRNKLPMAERMSLIYSAFAGGSLLSAAGLALLLLKHPRLTFHARTWEDWSWFLSPLTLLPAVPVVLRHVVWAQHHEDLLPIVIFGALIGEVLVAKAALHRPAQVDPLLRFLFSDKVGAERPATRTFIDKHGILLLVLAAIAFYGAFMSFYTVRWHHKLGTATFDLGINNNLIYGGLEGRINQSTVIFPEDPQKYLANHVKLGLYTLLPIYAFYPKAETLLVIQSVSLGLGALPLFLFARRRLPEWWAAAIALCYLAYYPMHGANFYEMKIVPTAAALVLFCIWAIDSKRWWAGGIFFLWALIMREDMPIPLAVTGVVFLLSGHRPRAGAIMAAVASVWFIFIRFLFMNEVGAWWFPNMYEDLWAEPERGFRGVILTLISNPTYTLKHIFVEKKFWYLLHLLAPVVFIPMRRWWGWAALVPGAILTLLVTDYAPPILFSFQYVMHWSPYLFIATALVLASMRRTEEGRAKAIGAFSMMCLASAGLSFNYGAFSARDHALESGYHKIEFSFSKQERETYEDVKRLVASIPPRASVASTERIGAHLSSRSGFYTLRRGSHGAQYIVARKKGLNLDRTKKTVFEALESGQYGVVGRYGEFIVFKKGADTKENEEIILSWRLDSGKKRPRRNPRQGLPRRDAEDDNLGAGEDNEEEDVYDNTEPPLGE